MISLYRYRSLQNFQFVADILVNNRFHTALYTELNDPMEGLFQYTLDIPKRFIDNIKENKRKLRLCSFSKTYRNLLLWAHYADGFRGICIEIKVGNSDSFEIKKVNYSRSGVLFSTQNKLEINEAPKKILSHKHIVWKYEQEARLLTTHPYIESGFSISAILLGIRTPEEMKTAIRSLLPDNIPVYETEISRTTNSVEKAGEFTANRENLNRYT